MRITIMLVAAAAVALVLTHSPERAEACSCRPPPPAQESYQEAAAVFIGIPQAIEEAGGIRVRVPMQVQRAYKGVDQARVMVTTARDSASCGYNFELDRPYLIYAHAEDDGLSVSLCSRTRALEDAQDDVQAIEAIEPGTVPGGQGQTQGPATKPPRADVDGYAAPEPTPPPAQGPPQQVEPGARGCGCRSGSDGTGAGLLAGAVALALLARRRRDRTPV
jgi:MYXO-CTERM domain-containing protein